MWFKRRDTGFYWHIHHDILIEQATDPIKERIEFIKRNKDRSEQKIRLHLLKKAKIPKYLERPIRDYADFGIPLSGLDEIFELHKNQCDPNCPFNTERRTIYGDILTVWNYERQEYVLLGEGIKRHD